jgi:hypothetical protein
MTVTQRTVEQPAQPALANPPLTRLLAAARRRVASVRAAYAQTLIRGQLGPVVGQRDHRRPEPPFSGPRFY